MGWVAEHNVGSAKVLARAGFVRVGFETAYAEGVGREVVEHIYGLTGSGSLCAAEESLGLGRATSASLDPPGRSPR